MHLPIDELLPEILQHLRRAPHLVLEAPPGAGKTTRVPAALLSLDEREVLVLEPRRLAARLAAQPEFAGKTIVVILPDSGERYLTSVLFEGIA